MTGDRVSAGAASPAPLLSVCCMSGGRRPALLAGVLASLRDVADEIVVAVEAPRAEAVASAVDGIADRVLAFPPTEPADRPIAWAFRACAGRWIFNVDDDEVPSPALVAALPALARRDDITHAWIPRRWVHPSQGWYITSPPWGNEFQLRFVLADERFLQFSDVFHRPVVCHGPSVFLEGPLWHLDTALNPAGHRRRKAASYERERPGMRIGGLAHNLGVYVPELHEGLDLAPVPDPDAASIAAALAGGTGRATVVTRVEAVPSSAVDCAWPGAPYPSDLYAAELSLSEPTPRTLYAGRQATVDVRLTNRGDQIWRWSSDARPAIALGYRWQRDGLEVPDHAALRTALPVDMRPGATELVPVHVVAPAEPGDYELVLELVHENVCRFGGPAIVQVDVRPRRRFAVLARPERMAELALELDLRPDVELVALLRDPADRGEYGDFETVVGLRPYLLAGLDERGRVGTLATLLRRSLTVARHEPGDWRRPGYGEMLALRDTSDGLLLDGPVWGPEAAGGREWAWVAATVLAWRRGGARVLVRDRSLPEGSGLRARLVRGTLRGLAGER